MGQSFSDRVTEAWKELNKVVVKGEDISYRVGVIEREIADRKQAASDGKITNTEELLDLKLAENVHAINLKYANTMAAMTAEWSDYWIEQTTLARHYVLDLGKEGIKFLLLLNSGTALGCLGLVTTVGAEYRHAVMWTMFGAIVGILMVTLGGAVLVDTLGKIHTRIRSYLLHHKGWFGISVITRYVGVAGKRQFKLVDVALYGSIVWFAFYTSVAFIILLNA